MTTWKILILEFTLEQVSIFYFISYNNWGFEEVKMSNSLWNALSSGHCDVSTLSFFFITPGSANFEGKTKQNQKTETKQTKNKKHLPAVFWLIKEWAKLLSSLEINNQRRKTIPLWNSLGKRKKV